MNSVLGPGNDVSAIYSAIYLDDQVSGFTVSNNTFRRTARALMLGGGRDNVFSSNVLEGTDGSFEAINFDNRGMTWGNAGCNASAGGDPILLRFLARVPYNSSEVWTTAFPSLSRTLSDAPCTPRHNRVSNNVVCGSVAGLPWIDATAQEVTAWGSVLAGNVNTTTC